MKIRIKGNTIRYRLTMSEVDAFSAGEDIVETTSFGKATFRYALKQDAKASGLHASFENDTITLWVPEKDATGWAQSAQIGFSHSLPLPGGESLFLLLEKDFVCLDETGEDQSDNFPNPRAQ